MNVMKEGGMCVGNRALLLWVTGVRKFSFKMLLLEISSSNKGRKAKISVYKLIITRIMYFS